MDVGDDVAAVDDRSSAPRGIRSATWSTAAILGHVDPLAPEHRLDPLAEPGIVGKRDEQADRLVVDPVLRVVEVQAAPPRRPAARRARGSSANSVAQMPVADCRVVGDQPLPAGQRLHAGRARRGRARSPQRAVPTALSLPAMQLEQVRATTSRTTRRPPSAAGRRARRCRCRPAANCGEQRSRRRRRRRAAGRADLAVVGEGEQGLLGHRVDRVGRGQRVDVQGRPARRGPWCRCWRRAVAAAGRPAFSSRCQRAERAARDRRGRAARRRRCRAGSCSSAGTRSATATSQRLTNSEATDATFGSSPRSIRRSTPRM